MYIESETIFVYIYNILYIPYVHIPHASGQAAQANWTPTDEPVTYEWGYAPSWLQAGSPFLLKCQAGAEGAMDSD